MTTERWKRIEEVYHAALELPQPERPAFVAQACGDDQGLLREVQDLVGRHRSGEGQLLEKPVWKEILNAADAETMRIRAAEPLAPGTRLGPYEISGQIGQGGMGQVFRAVDTRLGRTVAIKISLAHFSDRFAREARVIASLNHPNICTMFDVGPDYIVMELIEGSILSERIGKKPLPSVEALSVARQIAAALEAAHEQGIVHRDLKPANIMLRPDGSVKVLDFGLAKLWERQPDEATALSAAGMILGTPAYMSPEQARGEEVDKRADIWAFGVILYEMVTGERLFNAGSTAEVIAAVLSREPSLDRAPVQVRRLLAGCLEKDPRQRLRDIGDAMRLVEPARGPGPETVPLSAQSRMWPRFAAGLAVVAAVVTGLWWQTAHPPGRPLVRLSLDLGPNAIGGAEGGIAISPDGDRIVYPVRGPDGQVQLATRLLEQSEPSMLPGTAGGHLPFFSPDGQWVGYYTAGFLNRISIQGGAPVVVSQTGDVETGASWDAQGNIVAALNHTASLSLMPITGGAPRLFTRLAPGEQTHRWPQPLPGGGVLFTQSAIVMGMEGAGLAVADQKTGAHQVVLHGGYDGRYVPGGYLVYVHQGVLSAIRFDISGRKVIGSPVPLISDLDADSVLGDGHYQFAIAPNGASTLLYQQGKSMQRQWNFTLLDSTGKGGPLLEPGAYYNPSFSPDGKRLALAAGPDGVDVFVYDLARGTKLRLTQDGTADRPVWTPDGTGIIYGSKKTSPGLWWTRADGGAEPVLLLPASHPVVPWSLSPDGHRLAYFEVDPQTGADVWTLRLDFSDKAHPKAGRPEPFLRTQFHEGTPAFSPDGRWIAYFSNESGQNEVYVRPASGEPGKWQISNGGGIYPAWSRSGSDIFFVNPDNRLQVVTYTVSGTSIEVGKQRQWSAVKLQNVAKSNFAVAPDGKHLAVFEAADSGKGPPRVGVLLNFVDELKRKLP